MPQVSLKNAAMTHLRPDDVSSVHRKSSCRRGLHRYGSPRHVGGGILSQVCLSCGSVTIDLRDPASIDNAVVTNRLES